jgi:signal transduction histidine kinase
MATPNHLALRDLTLKTKLLLVMLSMLVLSLSALFALHYHRQQQLLAQVRDYTDDLSTALDLSTEIAKEQPATVPKSGDASTQLVEAYVKKLKALGVKGVEIADEEAVQASTDPANVGRPLVKTPKKKTSRPVIRGVLGEEADPNVAQRTVPFTIPIMLEDKRVGSIVLKLYLDDFSKASSAALMNQLVATLIVFAFGILLSLYLSWTFSRPLQDLSAAARQVASGDLRVRVPATGRDEIGSLASTFNDMVERLYENRQLEERLHFAERSTALGRLASAMAHEIRNPLNFMNLSIDHLRERLHPEDPERKEAFDQILGSMKAETSRLNRLVGDFLSFGKPMRLDPRPCSLDQVVRSTAALVEHKARDQGIQLTFTSEAELPAVIADPELLKTCFLNLMINACDAMPRGGELAVSVGRAGSDIEVVVRDTGHGMSTDAVKAAFEPYFSTKEAGLGLGLALTHKIVTDHGGRIELQSELDRGTVAAVRIPISEGPARESVA